MCVGEIPKTVPVDAKGATVQDRDQLFPFLAKRLRLIDTKVT